ncbi:MAG: hypothetical protein QOJ11_3160 [Frankiales bacterium]|jgi:hypothetical protein|nr:hypothetical protein [Frankiales bacterium]
MSDVPSQTVPVAPPGILEREGELAVLREALAAVQRTSRGRLVLVGAGAGDRVLPQRRDRPRAVARLAEPYSVDLEELYTKTSGNPFFVLEVLAGGDEGAIPETVRDAVLARAARLTQPARALLEAVAVVPPHADIWLLESLAGRR